MFKRGHYTVGNSAQTRPDTRIKISDNSNGIENQCLNTREFQVKNSSMSQVESC